jgi:hypothetical protein
MFSIFVLTSLGLCAWTAIRQMRDSPASTPVTPLEATP